VSLFKNHLRFEAFALAHLLEYTSTPFFGPVRLDSLNFYRDCLVLHEVKL